MKKISLSCRRLKMDLETFFDIKAKEKREPRFWYYRTKNSVIRFDLKEQEKYQIALTNPAQSDEDLLTMISDLPDTFPDYSKVMKKQITRNIQPEECGARPKSRKRNKAWGRFVSSQNRGAHEADLMKKINNFLDSCLEGTE